MADRYSPRQIEALLAGHKGLRIYPPAQGPYRWRSGGEVDMEEGCTPRVTIRSLLKSGLIEVCRDGRGGYELTEQGKSAAEGLLRS